jgi:hypothetical protein
MTLITSTADDGSFTLMGRWYFIVKEKPNTADDKEER